MLRSHEGVKMAPLTGERLPWGTTHSQCQFLSASETISARSAFAKQLLRGPRLETGAHSYRNPAPSD
jgi:hypothetical protein